MYLLNSIENKDDLEKTAEWSSPEKGLSMTLPTVNKFKQDITNFNYILY